MKKILITLTLSPLLTFASEYSLLNPVPKEKMREFNTDRPSKSDNVQTVDAGHFQFEGEIVSREYNRHQVEETIVKDSIYVFNHMTLKAGLTDQDDLQLIFPTLIDQRSKSLSDTQTLQGTGDLTIRLKHGLVGNEKSAQTGIALVPFIKLPTAGAGLSNDRTEGGIALPLMYKVSEIYSLNSTVVVAHQRLDDNSGWNTISSATLLCASNITDSLSAFIEVFAELSDVEAQGPATFDFGLAYKFESDVQLDFGINLGLTDAAEDNLEYIGLSFRL